MEKQRELNLELLEFIRRSPSVYHAADTISAYLREAGFTELKEQACWDLEKGQKYFVTRNQSSVLAFHIGKQEPLACFKIAASHSDSPTFAVKDIPELSGPSDYLRLNVEAYGGMIHHTWLDRPLGVAGRVMVRVPGKEGEMRLESRLVFIDRDLLLIPSLCIHFDREVNQGQALNRQVDLCPLFSAGKLKQGDFDRIIAEHIGVSPEQILGKNLFLVNRQQGLIWGAEEEFLSSPKLDDLECAFTSLKGFLQASEKDVTGINVFACFDNEEVGSNTKQGAMSTFLADTLGRINRSLGGGEEDYHRAVAASFLISFDNAHAMHPNHPEKSDAVNTPFLNKGIVIKENASQKYMTDAFSRGVFKMICEQAQVPCQSFANRSDVPGGATLGNLSNMQVSLHGVDAGLPQLSMHSAYETAGTLDSLYAVKAFAAYYGADLRIEGAQSAQIIPHID